MKLHSIAYKEHEDQNFLWQLDEFELSNINLIVGKNATGKSRILRIINGLARLIEGTILPNSISSGSYTAVFKDVAGDEDRRLPDIHYSLSIFQQKVASEVLISGNSTKLKRGIGGRAELYFAKNDTLIDVQIPETHLAVSVRQDSTQHPFFEPLHAWAATLKYFEFSKIENQIYSAFEGKIPSSLAQSVLFENNLHLIAKIAKERFSRTFDGAVIADMRQIGYEITDFGLMHEQGVALSAIGLPYRNNSAPQTLYVTEKDIQKKIPQRELSNGMVRALATLIFFNFIKLNKKRDCLMIDDIGEGLDFERAKKLISILTREAEKGYVQLVLSTNDRFIMNGVPLKYWSIVQRDKGKVSVFNVHNSSEAFSEFEEFGFNNFDFFSKKYYSKDSKK